jgi:hypothetical protein
MPRDRHSATDLCSASLHWDGRAMRPSCRADWRGRGDSDDAGAWPRQACAEVLHEVRQWARVSSCCGVLEALA